MDQDLKKSLDSLELEVRRLKDEVATLKETLRTAGSGGTVNHYHYHPVYHSPYYWQYPLTPGIGGTYCGTTTTQGSFAGSSFTLTSGSFLSDDQDNTPIGAKI